MSLYRYFQPSSANLPSAEEAGLGEALTAEANSAVREELERVSAARGKKRKRYTAFTDEERAKIGGYAAENGNSAALKKYRCDIPDLGESTVRLFKEKYLSLLHAGKSAAEVQVDMKISVRKEVSAAWLAGLYDNLRSQPEIIKNGFTKAGIEEALTDPVASQQED